MTSPWPDLQEHWADANSLLSFSHWIYSCALAIQHVIHMMPFPKSRNGICASSHTVLPLVLRPFPWDLHWGGKAWGLPIRLLSQPSPQVCHSPGGLLDSETH